MLSGTGPTVGSGSRLICGRSIFPKPRGSLAPRGTARSTRFALCYKAGWPALVVSVWVVPAGEDRPRLITAYPGDPK